MESSYIDEVDPFADPTVPQDQQSFPAESTLTVGRNASLTLGKDSLIVLGTQYCMRIRMRDITS